MELVDTRDLKSLEGNFVPVQVRLWAPLLYWFSMYEKNFMEAALDEAKIAYLNDEVPVGAVIVLDGRIIATGRNECIKQNSPIKHAEIIAIESACNSLRNYRLNNAHLYVTLEPCHMCAMAIVNARIEKIFFGAFEPKSGSVASVDNFFEKGFLNHKVYSSGGHMEKESRLLLKKFFNSKR